MALRHCARPHQDRLSQEQTATGRLNSQEMYAYSARLLDFPHRGQPQQLAWPTSQCGALPSPAQRRGELLRQILSSYFSSVT